MNEPQASLKALEFFKDWSNYLLVATVAALGWVAADPASLTQPYKAICSVLFALSIIFGIFTLALIPLVAEKLRGRQSFYDVRPEFDLLYVFVRVRCLSIKHVCWWQHLLFIAGIVVYAVAAVCDN